MTAKRIVFTGGGTGGHVYPNIAIYETIKAAHPQASFLYIGTRRGAEARIVPRMPQPMGFVTVPSMGLPQKVRNLKTAWALAVILAGTVKSFFILKRFRPDVVVGSGGYVAAPVMLAASILKLKVFVHEQNAVPGRLNRMISRYASRIGVSFASSARFFPSEKVAVTGYPLRLAITESAVGDIRRKLLIPDTNRVVFVFGGSGGARTINQAMIELMPMLIARRDLTVILSTGRGYSREYKAYDDTIRGLERIGCPIEIPGRLIIREYFDNIDEIYAVADLVVCRAGAGTIKEITTVGLPSIVIPKSDLPGDHQILNAIEVEKSGGCRVVYEVVNPSEVRRELEVPEVALFQSITELLDDDAVLQSMRNALKVTDPRESNLKILEEIDTLASGHPQAEEREIRVFYLQESETELTHELVFEATTVGNTLWSDISLDSGGVEAMAEIRQLGGGERLVIKPKRGPVRVNKEPVQKWAELVAGDIVEVGTHTLLLKSYQEKITSIRDLKSTTSMMMGSSLGIIFSRLSGFVREMVSAAVFGAGRAMDVFAVGLTVSNFMRRIVAENALDNAFLPIFLRLFHRSSRKKTWEASSSLINFTLLISLLLTVSGILVTPMLIRLLYPGFVAKGIVGLTVNMTRLMFPYLFLVTVAAILGVWLKAFSRFGLAESSAALFSIGTIAGILMGHAWLGVYSLAAGVLLGGLLQILFLIPFTLRILRQPALGFFHRPRIHLSSTVNKKYYRQLGPISLDVFLSNTSEIVNQSLASVLPSGSISFLYFSRRIFSLPFAVISQAINSVILRQFSAKIALFDRERAKRLFVDGIRINLFLLVPVSILMIYLANPLVSLLLQRHSFDSLAVSRTAYALQFYAIGLVGWGIHSLTVRIFSARLDIKTSMKLNFFMLAVNIILAILLVRTSLGYAGLALAASISYMGFALIRIVVLRQRLLGDEIHVESKQLVTSLAKTAGAALMMVIVLAESRQLFARIVFESRVLEHTVTLLSLSFVGIAVYFLSSLLLKNTEILFFRNRWLRPSVQPPISMLSPFRFLERVSGDPNTYRRDFHYKINLYCSSPEWEIRNVGVKLIGLFQDTSKVSLLVNLLRNTREKGFIRRNALTALSQMKSWDPEWQQLFRRLLQDSYYEVRVATLKHLTLTLSDEDYADFSDLVRERLRRGGVEECLAAMKLVATHGAKKDLDSMEAFFLHPNSCVREGLLELLLSFHRRGHLTGEEVKELIARVLITSNNLQPEFRLKALIRRIYEEIG
ncbi:MAG TPA: murein biosynthesis integral membrane protein MurJ [Candidatus Aminicenantes bacterium]|nr:murein biosynthesis integral membrane protein MurJ [Candidatus Aminicenantes bacterium]